MNEKLYDTLEVCLQALEQGADPDAVLENHLELSHALRPLLRAAMQARALANQDIPEETLRRGRVRVLQRAAQMRETTRTPYRPLVVFRRLALSLALAFLLLLSATGLVRASAAALPGEQLYHVKRTWEEIRLLLTFDATIREQLKGQFEQERVNEIVSLLIEGREASVEFTGTVEEQNGNRWLISGIPVKISAATLLPEETLQVGAIVNVTGRTTQNGYVEAHQIEIVQQSATTLEKEPTKAPAPIKDGDSEIIEHHPRPWNTLSVQEENINESNIEDNSSHSDEKDDSNQNENDDGNENGNDNHNHNDNDNDDLSNGDHEDEDD